MKRRASKGSKLPIPAISVIKVGGSTEARKKLGERTVVIINDREVPLNPFVQKAIRGIILGFLSTLKGVKIEGDEDVIINVKRKSSAS